MKNSVLDWRAECIDAAPEIRKSTNKKLVLAMSGGVDSEIVAESFRLANIPFSTVICRFTIDLNSHDVPGRLIIAKKEMFLTNFLI